jgi:hypothetical protein
MACRKDPAEGTFTPLSSTDEPAGSQRSAARRFGEHSDSSPPI